MKHLYQRHEHSQAGEGLALAHTVHGGSESFKYRVAHQVGDVEPVVQAHQSDYKPPARRHRDNPERELCGWEECRAFPSKKHFPYCAGHARKLGMIE